MSKRTLLLLAPGYEELEAVAVVDMIRRAGIEMIIAGTVPGPVPSDRNVKIVPDASLDEVMDQTFDLIVLPGGIPGTENLARDERVIKLLKDQLDSGRYIGAICAAPAILDRLGITSGKTITCHPACQASVKNSPLSQERVVQDGQFITSQCAGSALEFGLKLVEFLAGREKMLEVNKGVRAIIE